MFRTATLVALVLMPSAGCEAEAERPEGHPPVILISLDTLRADHLGAYGDADALTPNLDAFARESIVFERAFSQAAETSPSHASVFTGLYPSELAGSLGTGSVASDSPFIAQILQLYGYDTGAFTAGGHLTRERGLDLGFDEYLCSQDFGSLYHTGPMALKWLDSLQPHKPYFLFVHGYDTHPRYLKPTPFGFLHSDVGDDGKGKTMATNCTQCLVDDMLLPTFEILMSEYGGRLRPRSPAGRAAIERAAFPNGHPVHVAAKDKDYVVGIYDGAVSYLDTLFGMFMSSLQMRGVLDEAVIIVMSDHGEQLGEHGLFWHGLGMDDEETHVVLMVRMPRGANGGRRVSGLVELIDLMPTITELTGATPPHGLTGVSLVPALRGQAFEGRQIVYSQGTETARMLSARTPDGRLTYTGLSPGAPLLADVIEAAQMDGPGLVSSEDLPASRREPVRKQMVDWIRNLRPPPSTESRQMSEELKQSLREHGYWTTDQ